MSFRYCLFSAVLLLSPLGAGAQIRDAAAKEKLKEAVRMVEAGDYAAGLRILREGAASHPKVGAFAYETGYAYMMMKQYDSAIWYVRKSLGQEGVTERSYQMLGNLYDMHGKPEEALKTYREGLRKYPGAGGLYLETGVVQMGQQQYDDALKTFETGIGMAPKHPSNYYWAGKLFLKGTDEKVWGMLYGELFMNLERGSKRTEEMSKLLFDTYTSQIRRENDTAFSVSFSKVNIVQAGKKDLQLPFGIGVYEPLLAISAALNEQNLEGFCRMREQFLNEYFRQKYNEKYPNVLFDYQRTVQKAGHLDAYNHWILMKGDEAGFERWLEGHNREWKAFMEWYGKNPLRIDTKHVFQRSNYH